MEKETVICAAIRIEDKIWRGHRHGHANRAMLDEMLYDHTMHEIYGMNKEQGFITSKNRFIGREEALIIHKANGFQSVDPGGYRGNILFSEDLY